MSLSARLRSFARSLVHRSSLESEMQSEVRFHMESRAADLEATGLTPAQALRQAKMEFGPVATHTDGMRRALGLRWLDELRGDVLYAARMLRRSPGFTLVAVGSLALAIGANTVIFSVTKSVLLDRLAVARPQELRLFSYISSSSSGNSPIHSHWGSNNATDDGGTISPNFSYPIYQLLRDQNHANSVVNELFAFKDLGEYSRLTATVDGHSDVVTGQLVSGNLYEQLDVHAQLGRAIQPSDDATPGAGAVIVISDALWSRMFGRSATVIGKVIELNLIPVTVIGVNPPSFTGAASVQHSPDVFFPLSMQPILIPWNRGSLLIDKNLWWVDVMTRVKPGTSDAKARAALNVWLQQDIRATMKVAKDDVMPTFAFPDGSQGEADARSTYAKPVYVLTALSGLVLLLACINLANLLLARSASRQRELAVRMAMGATRLRIMRQVLTESLLLSSLGGVAGFAIGYAGRDVIPHLLSASWQPNQFSSRFDVRIFAFSAAISILTAVLFGFAPAWQATRTEVNTSLKKSSASATRRREGFAGRSLVAFQIALSMLLVVGAGLFTRTLSNLSHTPLGFDPSNILLFSIQAPKSRYPAPKDIALHAEIESRIAAIPGVRSVTLTEESLVSGAMSDTNFNPIGLKPGAQESVSADVNQVGRDFFNTYRIPIRLGRAFLSSDTATSSPVAVVNQALVKRIYGSEDPIGKTFKSDDQTYQIIGVSANAKYDSLRNEVQPTFYRLYNQSKDDSVLNYAVKTSAPIGDILPRLRDTLRSVDKDLPLRDIRTQQEQIDATFMQERLFATLTGSFGVLALTLACIGIYGIMAYSVARRTNEIGVRMALGARAGKVLFMILRESVWMAVVGIALGVAGAFGLTRFVATMLYGLKAMDASTMIGAGVVLFVVAIAAGYGPARRASRIDPIVALRHE